MERATPATTDDNLLPFAFPAVERKKVTAAFDGGRLSSDGGVMLLSQAERRLGLAERLAAVIPDERDASRVTHRLPDILRARIVRRALSAVFGGAISKDTVSRVWRKVKGDWDAWNAGSLAEVPIIR